MSGKEDLFTPVHKGIRSMIYELGRELQTTDFTDRAATEALLARMEVDFNAATSANCVLCLLHAHAGDEETGPFPAIRPFDPSTVDALIEEHHAVVRRLAVVARRSAELALLSGPEERIEKGRELNQAVNEFFAYYLTHMNKEETVLVPMMREKFTDQQVQQLRTAVMRGMPRERYVAFLRWMLPALDSNELTEILVGMKRSAPPELLQLVTGIAATTVDAGRWERVRTRTGL